MYFKKLIQKLTDFFISGLLWQDSARYVWEWIDSFIRKMWYNLGLAPNDGPHDWPQPRLCICHLYHPRSSAWGCMSGKKIACFCTFSYFWPCKQFCMYEYVNLGIFYRFCQYVFHFWLKLTSVKKGCKKSKKKKLQNSARGPKKNWIITPI